MARLLAAYRNRKKRRMTEERPLGPMKGRPFDIRSGMAPAGAAMAPGPAPRAFDHARGSNQNGVRLYNERLVLSLIRRHRSLSKVEIARLTGLSVQTASGIVGRLEQDGLLLRRDPQRGRVGQPAIPFTLHPEGALSLGLKIGRRSCDLVLMNPPFHDKALPASPDPMRRGAHSLEATELSDWVAAAERLLRPRIAVLARPPFEYAVGAICLILSLILCLPIPMGNIPPAMAICVFSLAILEREHAIDEDMPHAHRILLRLLEGGPVGDRLRIEDRHVRKVSFLQQTSSLQPQVRRWQIAQPADSLLQRDHLLLADVIA